MTDDHAPLTDEELEKWDNGLAPDCFSRANLTVIRRLIAALRVSRAEVERLRAENAQLEKWVPSGW